MYPILRSTSLLISGVATLCACLALVSVNTTTSPSELGAKSLHSHQVHKALLQGNIKENVHVGMARQPQLKGKGGGGGGKKGGGKKGGGKKGGSAGNAAMCGESPQQCSDICVNARDAEFRNCGNGRGSEVCKTMAGNKNKDCLLKCKTTCPDYWDYEGIDYAKSKKML